MPNFLAQIIEIQSFMNKYVSSDELKDGQYDMQLAINSIKDSPTTHKLMSRNLDILYSSRVVLNILRFHPAIHPLLNLSYQTLKFGTIVPANTHFTWNIYFPVLSDYVSV